MTGRSFSTNAMKAVTAQETKEAFITLLTLSHADLAEPIRVCDDKVNLVSNGNTFQAFPFELPLPNESEDRPPVATLTIGNVDRQIVQALRSITSAVDVLIEIVLASTPDTVEMSLPDFKLKEADYNQLVVTGELSVEHLESKPFPPHAFVPSGFPALF